MGALEAVAPPDAALPVAPCAAAEQPPLMRFPALPLHAAVGTLALGGAERIVIDWATAAAQRHRVRLLVLRRAPAEWPAPSRVEIVRLERADDAALEREGAKIAASGNPQILCHLLTAAERTALERGGAHAIPVLHNARPGWIEPGGQLRNARHVIAVSQAAAADVQAFGIGKVSVVRHVPRKRDHSADARCDFRARWQVPQSAFVIGMIGGVKPQKAYPRALRMLAKLLERRDAWLVVLGGPTGRDGLIAWQAVCAQCLRLGLRDRVRLPGFVADAARALPAFDVLLNTSHYEGLSIATLEALAAGLPVVASAVGGQGELDAPGLQLLPHDASTTAWAHALESAPQRPCAKPHWHGFPAARLWTLMHLPPVSRAVDATLFVTANLNAGGAQRSLVNLAVRLDRSIDLAIAVCGDSTASAFTAQLREAGVRVFRTAGSLDPFDHAEALLRYAAERAPRNIVFWNVDAKMKLLVAKTLEHAPVRLIDVSPGAYAFEETEATGVFQTCIAYAADRYYARLHRLVLKYDTAPPACARIQVIPNGVPPAMHVRSAARLSAPRRVVVSGRIAPSKHLVEIVCAMRSVWERFAEAELHVLGAAEPRHGAYLESLMQAIGGELRRRVFLHGPAFDAPRRLAQFDLALVIGHHQGCPNAVLEAMAARLPVVANDSGGTRELVIDGRTGVLLADWDPQTIARGLMRLMHDAGLASRLARAGNRRVLCRFSMRSMSERYRRLLIGGMRPW